MNERKKLAEPLRNGGIALQMTFTHKLNKHQLNERGIFMKGLEDYTRFANEHKICYVSTVEGNQPHVRIQALWFADKDGFYFSTLKTKEVYRQLVENPRIEVCFYAPPKRPYGQDGSKDMGTMMRVSGEITFLGDEQLKKRLLNDRPVLRPNADKQVIFRIGNGEAWFWTAKDDDREAEIERVRF